MEEAEARCSSEASALKLDDKRVSHLLAHNSELKATIAALRSDVHDREQNIAAHQRTISALQSEERQALATKCARLESEKAELVAQCRDLQSEVTRLGQVDAENEKLRTNITLLKEENQELYGNIALLKEHSQAKCEAQASENNLVREHLELTGIRVEREARAWKQMWREEARRNEDIIGTLRSFYLDD